MFSFVIDFLLFKLVRSRPHSTVWREGKRSVLCQIIDYQLKLKTRVAYLEGCVFRFCSVSRSSCDTVWGWLKMHKTVVANCSVNQYFMNTRGRIVLFLREGFADVRCTMGLAPFANTRRSRGPARFVKKRHARGRAPFGRRASKQGLGAVWLTCVEAGTGRRFDSSGGGCSIFRIILYL